jgi:hypothetical protein
MDPIVTLQLVVDLALGDARRQGAGAPQVLSAETVTWRSGALGCPDPDMAYTQALVPGYRVLVRQGGQTLRYHAGRDGRPRLCPGDRAEEPLPDTTR